MEFTIDAHQLYQTLKRVNIQRRMYPYMQLRAEAGRLSLLTITQPGSSLSLPRMQVGLSSAPATLIEEGACIVHYQQLLHAAKNLPGMLRIQTQEKTLWYQVRVPSVHQMSVEMQTVHDFPSALFVEREEGESYTTGRSVIDQCDHCNSTYYHRVMDTYQVTHVHRQAVQVNRELLSSMCKQVLWATETEAYHRPAFTGIQVALIDHVLSFVVADGYCVVKRSQHLPEASSWSSPVLIPAARLAQALKLLPNTEILVESVLTEHQLMSTDGKPEHQASSIIRPELVRLSAENITITISLLDVPFPDYLAVIPSTFEARVRCATDDLLKAVKAVMPVDESHAAWFELSSTTGIKIQAKRDQSGPSALQEVSALQNAAQDTSILLNSWYVHAFLKMVTATGGRFGGIR